MTLPVNVQDFITKAIWQTMAAEFWQSIRVGSSMSILSDRPSEPGPEEFQSLWDPGSPALCQESRPSFLDDGERGEPDLLEDEDLGPEKLAFTGLFPLTILNPCFLKPPT